MSDRLDAYYGGVASSIRIMERCLAEYRQRHPEAGDAEILLYVGEILAALRKWAATHDALNAAEGAGRLLAAGRPGGRVD